MRGLACTHSRANIGVGRYMSHTLAEQNRFLVCALRVRAERTRVRVRVLAYAYASSQEHFSLHFAYIISFFTTTHTFILTT